MKHSDIQNWLRMQIAQKLSLPPESLELLVPFEEYGIDSLEAANFTGEIESYIGQQIDPATLWDYRTLWELSVHLAEKIGLELEYPENEQQLDALLIGLAKA